MEPLFGKRDLRRLILPLIAEQFLAVAVGMVDMAVVSSAGEAAMAGVSLVDMINVLLINIFAALATGGAVVASQLLGAREPDKACRSVHQLLTVAFLLSSGIMTVTLLFQEPMLRLAFGAIEDDVMAASITYFRISAISYPFLGVYNACSAVFRSMGDSKTPMTTSLGMNIINAIGDILLVKVFHMGVAGVAIPSLVSRALAAVALLVLIANPHRELHWDWKGSWKPDRGMIKRILRIGIPSAMENSFFQLGKILVMSIIAGFGTVQIAANAAANTLAALGCIPGQAMNLAMITVVGHCVGAGDFTQARQYTKHLIKLAYLFGGLLNASILLTMPWTLQLYNLSADTLRLAMILVAIHDGCAILIWPLSFTLPNALRAANDVRYPMVVSIFSMGLFRVLFSFILGQWMAWGVIGIWTAMIIDWLCRTVFFVIRFRGNRWQQHALNRVRQ